MEYCSKLNIYFATQPTIRKLLLHTIIRRGNIANFSTIITNIMAFRFID